MKKPRPKPLTLIEAALILRAEIWNVLRQLPFPRYFRDHAEKRAIQDEADAVMTRAESVGHRQAHEDYYG